MAEFWINFAFSIVFSLVSQGIIPSEHYSKFRKLITKIALALPPVELEATISELEQIKNSKR
jgi:hypothetical protein